MKSISNLDKAPWGSGKWTKFWHSVCFYASLNKKIEFPLRRKRMKKKSTKKPVKKAKATKKARKTSKAKAKKR